MLFGSPGEASASAPTAVYFTLLLTPLFFAIEWKNLLIVNRDADDSDKKYACGEIIQCVAAAGTREWHVDILMQIWKRL